MSEAEPIAPTRGPRRWLLLGAAGGAVTLLTASVVVLGPAGPSLAAWLANGRDVWRLGELRVEGVGGGALGDLQVRRATLADEDGVWAVAEDLTLKWEPLRLLAGDVALKSGGAERLIVLRQPTLAPPKNSGPVTIDTDLGAISIARIEFSERVTGSPSAFTLTGGAATRDGEVLAMKIDLTRIDAGQPKTLPPESLKLDYERGPLLKLTGALTSYYGGAFGALLGMPGADVSASAEGASKEDGSGRVALQFRVMGPAEAPYEQPSNVDLTWDASRWTLNGAFNLRMIPALEEARARFGPLIEIAATGDAPKTDGAAFQASVKSAELAGEARGKVGDDLSVVGPLAVTVSAARAGIVLPETEIEAGSARFEGDVEFKDDNTLIRGQAALTRWRRNGFTLDAEGPLEIRITPRRYAFESDLAGANVTGPLDELTRLMAKPRIVVKGNYDRADSVTRIERLSVAGPDFTLRGAGRTGGGDTRYEGEWSAPHLGAAIDDMSGALQGRWEMKSTDKGLELDVSGDGRGVAGRAPLAVLLGGAPKLEAHLTFGEPVARLDYARLNGRALRLGAHGVLSGAPTNIRLEASARGPVTIAGARLTGAIDATGAVTGSLDRPRLHMEAMLGAVDVGGVSLQNAKLGVDLSPEARGQGGRVTLAALLWEKPLEAQARLALRDDVLSLSELTATLAQLKASGSASFGPRGPNADLVLAGVIDGLAPDAIGKVDGTLKVSSPSQSATSIDLNAALVRARFGSRIAADELRLSATGPIKAMRASYSIKGWARDDRFALAGEGTAGVGDKGFTLSLGANGDYAGAPIVAREPVTARFDGPRTEARALLSLAAGEADLTWRADGDRLTAVGTFSRAPLHVLTAFMDQPVAGVIDGKISLAGAQKNLNGDLDFTLSGARLARRSRDSVDATIKATLGGGALRGRIDAKSGQGLVASAEGEAPVIAQAAPFKLAPAPGRRGRAHWEVSGPVEGLWDLFGPLDQVLSGRIEGAGDTTFGADGVAGSGALTLTNGAFEDKFTGVKLREMAANVAFDPAGLRLDRFAATDGRGGTITGSGRLDGPQDGHLDLTLRNLRILDRADAKATDHGAIKVTWADGKALLTGEIELAEADIRALAADAPVPVAVLDVVEINRAGPQTRAEAKQEASRIPLLFDLRVSAPGRVFTRTRGLDAEWSMDLRLRGNSTAPQIFGEANFIRGDFTLAGRRFELESGVIRFNGDPEDAEVALVAVADTPDLSVRVQVAGRAIDPEITLSSTPSLPEDEVLPQLLFGRSSRELSAFEAAQLAASLASLAGRSAFDIAGAARSAVDLDRLEVRQEEGGFLVSGGKYLTRDVYLEVSRGALGQAGTSLEWQVRPRFYVISSFRGDGDQRIALRWKKDY